MSSLSLANNLYIESKYSESEDSKYEHKEEFTWIISTNGKYVNCQGRIPQRGKSIKIRLLNEGCLSERKGNYLAEEVDSEIILYEIIDNKKHIIYRWKPFFTDDSKTANLNDSKNYNEDIKSDSKESDDAWNKQFSGHENLEILDEMLTEWKNNEQYEEIDFPSKEKSNSKDKSSSNVSHKKSKKKVIRAVKDKMYLIKGKIQSGKTQWMTDGIIKLLLQGKSSVIIFRQMGDLIQFKERLDERFQEIVEIFDNNDEILPVSLEYIIAKENGFSVNDFVDSLQGTPAKIFLLIGSSKQIDIINEKFKVIVKRSEQDIIDTYVLWIDEADYVDSGTEALKTGSLELMKKYAYAIVEISATILDIAGREDVQPSHLKILQAPASYRGIEDFLVIETKEEAKYVSKINDDIFQQDKALERIVDEFMNEKPTWNIRNDYHPNIMLINVAKTIKPQKKAFEHLKIKYPNVALILYIGDGVYLYHKSIPKTPFKINKTVSTITNGNHLFKNISPAAALLWLKRNGGSRRFSHIIDFSGEKAGRSISYGCKDEKAQGLKYWHLTHHRLVLPKNSPYPAVEQKCRLCSIFKTPIPLKLYVSEHDKESVRKAYWSQEEIIERSKSYPDEKRLKDIMAQLDMNKEKFTAGRSMTIDRKLKVCNRVSGYDGGLLIESYQFYNSPNDVKPNISVMLNEDKQKHEAQSEIDKESCKGILKELEKNIKNAVRRNDDTIVVKILRHFKALNNEGIDAVINLEVLHRLGVNVREHYTQWSKPGTAKGQYKILIEHHTGFSLNHEIRYLLRYV